MANPPKIGMLVNNEKHQDPRDVLVLKMPMINFSEDCKNVREFLLTALLCIQLRCGLNIERTSHGKMLLLHVK